MDIKVSIQLNTEQVDEMVIDFLNKYKIKLDTLYTVQPTTVHKSNADEDGGYNEFSGLLVTGVQKIEVKNE